MNKRQKSSIIVASLAAIAVTGSLVAGATYALFTSESKTNIAVTSGKVSVVASIDKNSLVTYSGVDLSGNAGTDTIKETSVKGTFTNGGTASVDDNGDLVLTKVTPGDKVDFTINVTNSSNVAVKYRTIIKCASDDGLFNGLKFTIGNQIFSGRTSKSTWTTLTANQTISQATLNCTVNLPSDAGNEYKDKSCKVSYTVEAVQGNAATSETHENTIEVYTVSDLKWVQKNVSEIDATKTVELMNNLDLAGENWTPIGIYTTAPFVATFNGNGNTISNLKSTKYTYLSGNKGYGMGLFGSVNNATIKDLIIEGANIGGDNAEDGVPLYSAGGVVTGYSYGSSTFDKITVRNSTVKAQTKIGAIVGLNGDPNSTTKITDCKVEGVTIKGNYSYSLVAGLLLKGSTINFTGTSVDSTSKTEYWESDKCDYKQTEATKYIESGIRWDYYSQEEPDPAVTQPNNAWAVQRGNNGKKVTCGDDTVGVLWDNIIYTDASNVIKLTATE